MEQIRASLSRLTELSVEELEELSAEIIAEAGNIDQTIFTDESVAALTEFADAVEAVDAELADRKAKAAELAAQAQAAVERINKSEASATDEDVKDDEDAEVVPDDEDKEEFAASEPVEVTADATVELAAEDAEAAAEEVAETAADEEPVDEAAVDEAPVETEAAVEETPEVPAEAPAEASTITDETELSAETGADAEATETPTTGEEPEATIVADAHEDLEVQAPASHLPKEIEKAPALTASVEIKAGGDLQGFSNGSIMAGGMTDIAKAMAKRIHDIRNTNGGDGEQFSVATIHTTYPESRQLFSGADAENKAKIADVAAPESVTAAGGFCAPVEVSYDIFGFGSDARPVKEALASFQADRGGIRYSTSPRLGDLDGAVSLWTLQDDIDAATPGAPDPVKPCLRVECGDEVTVYTDAIPLCLTFGNLQTRAFPELVARNNELALITHARYAETRILTRLGSLSTAVTAGQKLGAARDFLVQVDQAVAGYRSRHRLDDNFALRVIAPYWLKNLLRADLVNNMPGDGNLDLADSEIARWFSTRSINVSWTLDGETGQIFGTQNAGALTPFPSTVIWYLFAEGTFLFLDGGTLDIGLVRDSGLVGTNDYKVFLETFEGVAKVGIESLKITSSLKANGAVAGTVDPATL